MREPLTRLRRVPASGRLALLPSHVVVLLLTALAGVIVAYLAAGGSGVGLSAGQVPADQARALLFAVSFNVLVAAALAAAWPLELVALVVRPDRRGQPARALARLVLAGLPLAALAGGHLLLNPWMEEIVRGAWRLARPGIALSP